MAVGVVEVAITVLDRIHPNKQPWRDESQGGSGEDKGPLESELMSKGGAQSCTCQTMPPVFAIC